MSVESGRLFVLYPPDRERKVMPEDVREVADRTVGQVAALDELASQVFATHTAAVEEVEGEIAGAVGSGRSSVHASVQGVRTTLAFARGWLYFFADAIEVFNERSEDPLAVRKLRAEYDREAAVDFGVDQSNHEGDASGFEAARNAAQSEVEGRLRTHYVRLIGELDDKAAVMSHALTEGVTEQGIRALYRAGALDDDPHALRTDFGELLPGDVAVDGVAATVHASARRGMSQEELREVVDLFVSYLTAEQLTVLLDPATELLSHRDFAALDSALGDTSGSLVEHHDPHNPFGLYELSKYIAEESALDAAAYVRFLEHVPALGRVELDPEFYGLPEAEGTWVHQNLQGVYEFGRDQREICDAVGKEMVINPFYANVLDHTCRVHGDEIWLWLDVRPIQEG